MRLLLATLLAVCAGAAQADAYPTKPVRLIIPFPPGGSNDVVGRAAAQQLGERLGQPIVIDNRGGAGGTIGINAAAKSTPDGYTLLLVSVGFPVSIALGQLPEESLGWFEPVGTIGTGPSLLVVPSSLPVKSTQDLVAAAKSKPGALNAASAGVGSFQHLATELFRLEAGIDIVIVQYKGGGPALTDTIAGQVQMNVGSAVQNVPQVRAGKLRALGVGGPNRLAALPDVPTFAEAGLPGATAANWWGIVAPKGTPAEARKKVADDLAAVVESAEMRKRFEHEGAEPLQLSAQQFAAHMAAETKKWTRVVRAAHIKPQ
jgi:tripartite-type tricarboxylate transporter receptor subunit TctC